METGTRGEITVRALRRTLVLIVDDDPAVRGAVARLLRHHGFEVIEAESGDAAMEQLRACPGICIVLLDQSMPNGSGPSFAARFRVLCPSIRLIIHSAQPVSAGDRVLFDDVIQKPAEIGTLVRLLDHWAPEAHATVA